jgi:acetylornithine/succinyldiaminopimelate/putrescine aminotransferase
LEHARQLGIANATHNNIRGHITRLLEERLICRAAGGRSGSSDLSAELTASQDAGVLNRVLNLETGSLAAEAAVKMILARFHRIHAESGEPKHAGRVPVFGVLADDDGTLKANYHGTTLLTQFMRGMWPEMLDALERSKVLAVRAVRPNDMEGLEAFFAQWDTPPYKVAGFFHELVMMNYGARALTREFVSRLYALCRLHDAPAVVDEIQTCVWSPELFMFREYGVKPEVVVLGKGFPGGEYAASRVLFSAAMDNLPQFGALVTNGQEELASLAYLVTMRWAEANASVTCAVGEYYEARVREMADAFPDLIAGIEGRRHMLGVHFVDLPRAKEFTRRMQEAGLDISVQTYKEGCPPCALTKLPLICGYVVVDFIVERMRGALAQVR